MEINTYLSDIASMNNWKVVSLETLKQCRNNTYDKEHKTSYKGDKVKKTKEPELNYKPYSTQFEIAEEMFSNRGEVKEKETDKTMFVIGIKYINNKLYMIISDSLSSFLQHGKSIEVSSQDFLQKYIWKNGDVCGFNV